MSETNTTFRSADYRSWSRIEVLVFTYLGSHEGEDVNASVDVADKDGEEKEEGAARLNGRQQHQDLDV